MLAVNNTTLHETIGGFNESTATGGGFNGLAFGVIGGTQSPNGFGAVGVAAPTSATFTNDSGFQAIGVSGDSGSAGGIGVWGTADSGYAVVGENNGSYVTGLFLNSSSTTSYALEAGSSSGVCTIDTKGDLVCNGSKSAAVPLPDNRWVRLYAVESPDNWFEDLGSGTLTNGTAAVHLDPTFAQTVNANVEYHVFITPNGESEGLYVVSKTAGGFEVREQHGGHSNIAFDYRIVGKRKGYENVRLEDVTERQNMLAALRQQLTRSNDPATREQLDRMLHPHPSHAGHPASPAVRAAAQKMPAPAKR